MTLSSLYKLVEFVLRLISFPLGSEHPVKPVMRFFQFYLIFCHLFVAVPLLISLVVEEQSFETIIEAITYIGLHIASATNLIYYYANAEKVQRVYRRIKDVTRYETVSRFIRKGRNIDKEIRMLKFFIWSFILSVFVACDNLVFVAIYNYFAHGERTLISGGWFPYDPKKKLSYEITFLFQTTAMHDIGIAHGASDIYYMTVVCLLSFSLKFLRYEFEESFFITLLQEGVSEKIVVKTLKTYNDYGNYLEDENGEEMGIEENKRLVTSKLPSESSLDHEDVVDRVIYTKKFNELFGKNLREKIVMHETYLEILDEINGFFWPILFFQLTMNIFYLILIPLLAIMSKETTNMSALIQRTTTSFCQLAIITFTAQLLNDESIRFQETIYSCPWYKCDANRRKMFLIVLIRCIRPMYIKAGKYLNITSETFLSITNLVFSFVTVLLNFTKYKNDDEEL